MSATLSAKRTSKSLVRSSPIGLDVGARYVHAAQLVRANSSDGWKLHAAASFPRATESYGGLLTIDEANRIADVLFRRNFLGSNIVLAVPDEKLLTTNLELPPRTGEIPLDEIARAEFVRSLKVESDPIEFAYWDLPAPARAAKTTHVMAVGCKHADCEPAIDALESASLELRAIDVAACALTRACQKISAPPNEITAIADIGWRAVRLFVVHQGVVSYQRSLAGYGIERLHGALAEQFNAAGQDAVIEQVLRRVAISDVEIKGSRESDALAANVDARRVLRSHFDAVTAEIITSLSYTSHQYPDAAISRVVLCGGGASIKGLADYVKTQLTNAASSVDVSQLVRTSDEAIGADPSLTLAVGLAMNESGAN
jgi:type IV pilus assembly protein PilM